MTWKTVREVGAETLAGWRSDDVPKLSAALAFYAVFSIAPMLVIVIAIAASVFGAEAAAGRIFEEVSGLLGERGADAIRALIRSAYRPGAGVLATGVAVVAFVFGATAAFAELHESLNIIWKVKATLRHGVWAFVRARLLSLAMILVVALLVLVGLVVSTGSAALGAFVDGRWPALAPLLGAVNTVVSFGMSCVLFAMLYKILPDTHVEWRHAWVGAAGTALLFALGRWLIGLYLRKVAVGSAYGAAGTLAVLLLWFYYSAQVLFLGAELAAVHARRFGSRARVPPGDARAVAARP